ncbi:MAG: PIN domain-containing protein [Burkholderiaceae bacterium]|nr:PIN domain-containing protein [Burkholderiaceae bacterium]
MSEARATIAVLDTNVWLDWLLFGDPRVEPLRAAAADRSLRLLASTRCRDELAAVLERPRLIAQARAAHGRRGTQAPSALDTLRLFDGQVEFAADSPVCALRCTDSDDQHLIDLAVEHRAHWLLSRDRAVLALARRAFARHGVTIARPERFESPPAAPRPRSGPPTIDSGERTR